MTSIDIQNQALRSALEQALNHPPPFSVAECQSFIGPLQIQHARDLSELQHCPKLQHLELFASDIADLGILAALPDLSSLSISCSRVNTLQALTMCRNLAHVEICFTD